MFLFIDFTGSGPIIRVECMCSKTLVNPKPNDFLFVITCISLCFHNLIFNSPGDFVKHNGLEIGDSLTLYEDQSKNRSEEHTSELQSLV